MEYKDKIMENGVHYDELSEEEKRHVEDTFADDPAVAANKIAAKPAFVIQSGRESRKIGESPPASKQGNNV